MVIVFLWTSIPINFTVFMTCLLGYGSVLRVERFLYITHVCKEGRFFLEAVSKKLSWARMGPKKCSSETMIIFCGLPAALFLNFNHYVYIKWLSRAISW